MNVCITCRVGGVRNDPKQQFFLRVEPHNSIRWPLSGFDQRPLPMQHMHYPAETRTRVIVLNRDSYWIYRLDRVTYIHAYIHTNILISYIIFLQR